MRVRLRKLGKGVPVDYMETIIKVFPLVYDTFKKHCPGRKNMICYGYVIIKLLEKMGMNGKDYGVKTVVTKAKIKENERLWNIIDSNCGLNI